MENGMHLTHNIVLLGLFVNEANQRWLGPFHSPPQSTCHNQKRLSIKSYRIVEYDLTELTYLEWI